MYIRISNDKFIKANQFYAYYLNNEVPNEPLDTQEIVFYLPGLRFLYNEYKNVLELYEQLVVKAIAKTDPPEVKENKEHGYTILTLDNDELTEYDLMSIPLNDFLSKITEGKSVIVEVPILNAKFSLATYTSDYIDPINNSMLPFESYEG